MILPMTRYIYPFRDLAPDYGRAAAGLLVTAAPLPWLPDSPVSFAILAALALAFGAYGLSTWIRQRTIVRADAQAIASEGLRRVALPWDALETVDLRYFSTRRDRQRGWMQLRLAGGGRRITIDSALDGFTDVARCAADEAAARGVELSEITRSNLRALGIEPPRGAPDRAAADGEPA